MGIYKIPIPSIINFSYEVLTIKSFVGEYVVEIEIEKGIELYNLNTLEEITETFYVPSRFIIPRKEAKYSHLDTSKRKEYISGTKKFGYDIMLNQIPYCRYVPSWYANTGVYYLIPAQSYWSLESKTLVSISSLSEKDLEKAGILKKKGTIINQLGDEQYLGSSWSGDQLFIQLVDVFSKDLSLNIIKTDKIEYLILTTKDLMEIALGKNVFFYVNKNQIETVLNLKHFDLTKFLVNDGEN